MIGLARVAIGAQARHQRKFPTFVVFGFSGSRRSQPARADGELNGALGAILPSFWTCERKHGIKSFFCSACLCKDIAAALVASFIEALNTASALGWPPTRQPIPRRSGHKRRSVLWYGLAHFFLDFHADAFYMFTGFSGAQYLATAAMVRPQPKERCCGKKTFPESNVVGRPLVRYGLRHDGAREVHRVVRYCGGTDHRRRD